MFIKLQHLNDKLLSMFNLKSILMKNVILKKTVLLFGLLLVIQMLKAQNPAIILAPNFINTLTPQFLPQPLPTPTNYFGDPSVPISGDPYAGYAGQSATNTSNLISKPDGSILFFVVDEKIYDENGYIIDFMDQYDGPGSAPIKGAAEMMIVPNPGNCSQYYIFTTHIEGFNKTPYVYLLDMSAPNIYSPASFPSLGALVPLTSSYKWKKVSDYEPLYQSSSSTNGSGGSKLSNVYFAASPLRSGTNDYLIFISDGSGIFRFRLNSTGLVSESAGLDFGPTAFNPSETRAEMELVRLSNGNYRIATIYAPYGLTSGGYDVKQAIYSAELNSNGVLISGTVKRFPVYHVPDYAIISGIEFSQDGRYLYVTHLTNSVQPHQFEHYDFNTPTSGLVPLTVPSGIDLRYSQLELGANNVLYFANQNGLYSKNAGVPSSTIASAANFTYIASTESGVIGGITPPANRARYLLSDQIDGEDYNAHFSANPQCCIANNSYTKEIYTATSSGTWSNITVNPLSNTITNTIRIKDELRIPAGVTVTINNMTFEFAPGARVIIENGSVNGNNGGKLILNGTTFTVDDRCGANLMWLGVEVWGNQNLAQGTPNFSKQGWLSINNSKIEHAHIGVVLSQRNGSNIYSFNDSRNGGVVQSINSEFYNNIRSVWFRKYIAPNGLSSNLSFFRTTDFKWFESLLEGSPQEHLRLESVKGIKVNGCMFSQSRPSISSFYLTGRGILARESSFFVDIYCPGINLAGSPCPSPSTTTFENLTYGVYSTNSSTANSFSVQRSKFENCKYGVYAFGTQKERITQNIFEVAELANQSAGVVLNRSTGYKVEENTFYEFDNPTITNGSALSYGVVAINSDTAHNEIYKNEFYNLKVGGQSDLINSMFDETVNNSSRVGLQWKCNTFKTQIYEADLGVNGIIDYQQGFGDPSSIALARKKAARNRFSMFGEDDNLYPDHDIKITPNSGNINYWYLTGNDHEPDNYTGNKVAISDATAGGNTVYATNDFSECPTNLSTLPGVYKQMFTTTTSELSDVLVAISEGGVSPDEMEELLSLKNQLIRDKQYYYNNYTRELLLSDSLEFKIAELNGFLEDYSTEDNYILTDLLELNIQRGILSNQDIVDDLQGNVASEYLDLAQILADLRDIESIDVELATNTNLFDQLIAISENDNSFLAYRALALLEFNRDELYPAETFLPLSSRSHISNNAENIVYSRILMYPNPTNGIVNFKLENQDYSTISIELYDLTGALITKKEMKDTLEMSLDYSAFQSGTYIVKIAINGDFVENKLLVLK